MVHADHSQCTGSAGRTTKELISVSSKRRDESRKLVMALTLLLRWSGRARRGSWGLGGHVRLGSTEHLHLLKQRDGSVISDLLHLLLPGEHAAIYWVLSQLVSGPQVEESPGVLTHGAI